MRPAACAAARGDWRGHAPYSRPYHVEYLVEGLPAGESRGWECWEPLTGADTAWADMQNLRGILGVSLQGRVCLQVFGTWAPQPSLSPSAPTTWAGMTWRGCCVTNLLALTPRSRGDCRYACMKAPLKHVICCTLRCTSMCQISVAAELTCCRG
jgi:hypothetical protein